MYKRLSLLPMKVMRMKSGVALLDSAALQNSAENSLFMDTGATVADFMRLPVSFWILDTEGATKIINPEGIEVCGFRSEKDAIGHSIEAVSKRESAIQLIGNCEEVIRTREFRIYEENNIRKDGIQQQFLSIKLPLYDLEQNVVGVCGFSIVLGRHSLAQNLSVLSQFGIMNQIKQTLIPNPSSQPLTHLTLPPREQQCMQFILRGYTAKMIARELGLSFRTIESYINNLKARLGVNTRMELIQIATR